MIPPWHAWQSTYLLMALQLAIIIASCESAMLTGGEGLPYDAVN